MSSTSINEMEKKNCQILIWGLAVSFPLCPRKKEKKNEERRHFACLDVRELVNLAEEAQAKSTKYLTKYAVNVFQGNFCI